MSNFFYTTVQKAFYFLLEFFSRWKYRIFEVFNHSDMSMLCVLQSRIIHIHKPSNKLFSPKLRAFLRNINIDRTFFYLLKPCFSLSLPSHCILNTRPIPNDHLVEMELEGNMVEKVVEAKWSLHCCSSWTTSWWSAGLIILELTVKIFLA